MIKAATAILLAAGSGRRMVSKRQKAMHPICGRPMLSWVMRSVHRQIVSKPVTVVGFDQGSVREYFGMDATYAEQQRLGSTAEALRCGMEMVREQQGCVLVIPGNMPMLSENTISALAEGMKGAAASRLVCISPDGGASIRPVYCFDIAELRRCLKEDLAEVEDCIIWLRERGSPVLDVYAPEEEGVMVIDRGDLWDCSDVIQRRINIAHMKNGVTFIDPHSAYVDAGVKIGMDTVIYPDVYLSSGTEIGEGCTIYNGCRLANVKVGNGCVLQAVVGENAIVNDGAKIGPFVRLRPDASVGKNCKIGNFVEIKNSTIGEKTSIAHLTYVGDADVGSRVNMGCGTVFVNYDGFKKHRSTVGDDVFLGCQTALVSPVNVGDRAYTAAGTVLTGDVPADALAISRGKQQNKEGWAERYRELKSHK